MRIIQEQLDSSTNPIPHFQGHRPPNPDAHKALVNQKGRDHGVAPIGRLTKYISLGIRFPFPVVVGLHLMLCPKVRVSDHRD